MIRLGDLLINPSHISYAQPVGHDSIKVLTVSGDWITIVGSTIADLEAILDG